MMTPAANGSVPPPSPQFTPSLQHFADPDPRPAQPWSPRAQFFVAFFGGVTALGIFAFLNARRLRVSPARIALMVGLSLAAWLTYWVGTQTLPALPLGDLFGGASAIGPASRAIRIAGRALALVLYLVLYWIQKPADRIYRSLWEGAYASPWRAGIGVVLLGILIDLPVAAFLTLSPR